MKIVKTHPLKKPKDLKKNDRDKIKNILKTNKHLLSKDELRIFKNELKDVE